MRSEVSIRFDFFCYYYQTTRIIIALDIIDQTVDLMYKFESS